MQGVTGNESCIRDVSAGPRPLSVAGCWPVDRRFLSLYFFVQHGSDVPEIYGMKAMSENFARTNRLSSHALGKRLASG